MIIDEMGIRNTELLQGNAKAKELLFKKNCRKVIETEQRPNIRKKIKKRLLNLVKNKANKYEINEIKSLLVNQ